jgi:sugar/nucleoside kinase (ribokinase family)
MKRILGIGNALVDVMTVIDNDKILGKFNLPKGSMQLVDDKKSALVKEGTKHFQRSLTSGGSAANTIHGISMLGGQAGFIGSIGKDETGDFFETDLKKSGVKTFLQRRKTVTGTAVALISPDSQRTFATHLGAAVELNAENLNPEDFDGYHILYLEGYLIINKKLTIEACKIAKSRKMKIAIDLASYNVVEANLDAFKEVINEYADIVFANEEEAKAFTGKGPKAALNIISRSCEIAIVKTGRKGSWIRRGDELIKIGVPSVKPVDTTGAGDMYAAGFLYGYARNLSLDQSGAIAAIAAGKVIEIVGARLGKEKWAEIKKSISEITD